MSPMLYSIYLDLLVFKLRIFGQNIRLGDSASERHINSLLYADDIVLISKTRGGLQKLLGIAERDSISRGYRFSPTKCVILSPIRLAMKLYGAPLPHQRSFTYVSWSVIFLSWCSFKKNTSSKGLLRLRRLLIFFAKLVLNFGIFQLESMSSCMPRLSGPASSMVCLWRGMNLLQFRS